MVRGSVAADEAPDISFRAIDALVRARHATQAMPAGLGMISTR
jgi:hypothetical protein